MLRRLAFIGLIMTVVPSPIHAQTHVGLRAGVGLIHGKEQVGYSRYRLLLGQDGSMNLLRQEAFFFNIGVETEKSYSWYDYDMRGMNAFSVGALLDLFPEFGLILAETVKPSFGAGLTLGLDALYQTSDEVDFEATSVNARYGFHLRPSLMLEVQSLFARGTIKYRYLLASTHWEYESGWDGRSGDDRYSNQSFDMVLSAGMRVGEFSLEGGIQAENWVYKHEDLDRWPKWPKDWEYMMFGRGSVTF